MHFELFSWVHFFLKANTLMPCEVTVGWGDATTSNLERCRWCRMYNQRPQEWIINKCRPEQLHLRKSAVIHYGLIGHSHGGDTLYTSPAILTNTPVTNTSHTKCMHMVTCTPTVIFPYLLSLSEATRAHCQLMKKLIAYLAVDSGNLYAKSQCGIWARDMLVQHDIMTALTF